jgi:hypothetical protein
MNSDAVFEQLADVPVRETWTQPELILLRARRAALSANPIQPDGPISIGS